MSAAIRSHRWLSLVAGAMAFVMIGCVIALLGALASGYRPVVIKTGSMGDAAPAGSLVVAAPRSGNNIVVGDIIVMSRPGSAPITHRLVGIERTESGSFAITRGDANPSDDPVPYQLGENELVARWVVPRIGTALESFRDPRSVLVALSLMMTIATLAVLRRIWTGAHRRDPEVSDGELTDAIEAHDPGAGALTACASIREPSGTAPAEFFRSADNPTGVVRPGRSAVFDADADAESDADPQILEAS